MESCAKVDYWDKHGILYILGLLTFPRLTILFFCTVEFGLFEWALWLFFPTLLVAILATRYYWETNEFMCIASWFLVFSVAFGNV